MSSQQERPSARWRRPDRRTVLVLIAILIIVGGVAIGLIVRGTGPSHPDILNEPTQAREVRPLTTSFDPRFDPLPIEEEKH
jgi:hypothetical protein